LVFKCARLRLELGIFDRLPTGSSGGNLLLFLKRILSDNSLQYLPNIDFQRSPKLFNSIISLTRYLIVIYFFISNDLPSIIVQRARRLGALDS
jgi:hypothetical protein